MQFTRFVPEFFRERVLWCTWRLELDKNGRWTKIPYSAVRSGKASSTDPNTWSTFEQARQAFKKALGTVNEYSGLGIVFHESLNCIFIDVDHCINAETGEIDERGTYMLNTFPNTYAELSQSKTGLHFFVLGKIPKGFKNSKQNVEMYYTGRYCAFTACAVQACEPSENQEGLNEVFAKFKTPDPVQKPLNVVNVAKVILPSDQEILEKLFNNRKYADLFNGKWEDYFSSQSEADISLCESLAFWCDRDHETIDRLFRSSALYRSKWDEKHGAQTYGFLTIQKACAYLSDSYTEWRNKKNAEVIECILSEW